MKMKQALEVVEELKRLLHQNFSHESLKICGKEFAKVAKVILAVYTQVANCISSNQGFVHYEF